MNLVERNHKEILNYLKMGEEATLAVPTLDHYIPMVFVLGLAQESDRLEFVYEGFQHGSVSMRAFRIG